MVAKLRGTDDAEGLYAILTEPAANPSPTPRPLDAPREPAAWAQLAEP